VTQTWAVTSPNQSSSLSGQPATGCFWPIVAAGLVIHSAAGDDSKRPAAISGLCGRKSNAQWTRQIPKTIIFGIARMTLSDLANIAEIVGSIAVVISLVYLAMQIRQNTKTVRNATLQSNTALWSSLLTAVAEPGLVEAYAAGLSGTPNIQSVHYTQFFLLCRGIFVAFENQYYQFREGALDQETYEGYERAISQQLLAFPGFRLWWRQSSSVFSPTFVAHVDEMIRAVPVAAPDKFYQEWQAFQRQ